MEFNQTSSQKDIIDELTRIVSSLGTVYMDMAQYYPALLNLMDEKFSLFTENGHGETTRSGITYLEHAVENLQHTVDSASLVLKDLTRKDSVFFDRLAAELEKISEFEAFIETIEDDSAELELVSLNAMVTALKAGKNGGAFPYITEELQSVSKRSAQLSAGLKTQGTALDQVFRNFLENINNEKISINNAMDGIGESLGSMLELIKNYRRDILSLINELKPGMESIRTPMYHILQEVQKHDIVRQSIDHVILSLDKGEEIAHSTVEEKLDYLSYRVRVLGFCQDILTEIQSSIRDTYELFNSRSDDLSSLMVRMKSAGQAFLIQQEETSYSDRIGSLESEIQTHADVFRKGSNRDFLKSNLNSILKEISRLEEASNGFARIINWIKTINISSRVEAAKLPHLANMNYIIENINSRTDSIEGCVENIIRYIANFKKNTDNLFSDFFSTFGDDAHHLNDFLSNLKNGLHQVTDSHGTLDLHTLELVRVGREFDAFYERTRTDLKTMNTLIENLENINETVTSLKNRFNDELEIELEKSEYRTWELHGNEIRELIDKFTIFVHKQKVDDSHEVDLDGEGAESGEITLF